MRTAMYFDTLATGDQLDNGGVVALAGPVIEQPGCFPSRIVLAHLPWNDATPFVVWLCWDNGASYPCAHGDYCENLDEALEAFAHKRERHERQPRESVPGA